MVVRQFPHNVPLSSIGQQIGVVLQNVFVWVSNRAKEERRWNTYWFLKNRTYASDRMPDLRNRINFRFAKGPNRERRPSVPWLRKRRLFEEFYHRDETILQLDDLLQTRAGHEEKRSIAVLLQKVVICA